MDQSLTVLSILSTYTLSLVNISDIAGQKCKDVPVYKTFLNFIYSCFWVPALCHFSTWLCILLRTKTQIQIGKDCLVKNVTLIESHFFYWPVCPSQMPVYCTNTSCLVVGCVYLKKAPVMFCFRCWPAHVQSFELGGLQLEPPLPRTLVVSFLLSSLTGWCDSLLRVFTSRVNVAVSLTVVSSSNFVCLCSIKIYQVFPGEWDMK